MAMRCLGCGELNEPGFAFCRNCGSALPQQEDMAATAAITVPAATPAAPPAVAAPQPDSNVTYKLVATGGLLAGRTFTLGPRGLMIGRDPASCQVVLADDEISRTHAWVGFDSQERVVVRDRNSANGTYVNQVRIQERIMRPTDELEVGADRRHVFRVERTGGEVLAPPPAPGTDRIRVARAEPSLG
ncbi:MAG: FHA domain-containing protein, partial [Burkholderiales bacterium]